MRQEKPLQVRGEELIGAGRLLLGASTLAALIFNPAQAGGRYSIALAAALAFCAYAMISILIVRRLWLPQKRWLIASQILDLVFFSAFVLLTQGSESLFFVPFLFALVCSVLRFEWQGTLWTTLATIAIFAVITALQPRLHQEVRLAPFVLRVMYLGVMGGILTYMNVLKGRVQREFGALAEWPIGSSGEVRELVNQMLGHALALLHVERLVVMWEEAEEAGLQIATRHGTDFTLRREIAEHYQPLVAQDLLGASFVTLDAAAQDALVLVHSGDRWEQRYGAPLNAEVQKEFGMTSVISCRIDCEVFEGRIFFLDRTDVTADDLVLAEIVAKLFSARLERFLILQELRQAAVRDERARLARDLHDWLLQSLTAVALQLEVIARYIRTSPSEAAAQILGIQEMIAADQKELRSFITDLRPQGNLRRDTRLQSRLQALSERFRRQWGIDVQTNIEPMGELIPDLLKYEVYNIVNEAVANAAKHAAASRVVVGVEVKNSRLEILVHDNGQGFPFMGRYNLDDLIRLRRGPVTLKERVCSLGGSMVIDSTPAGSLLAVELPFAQGRLL